MNKIFYLSFKKNIKITIFVVGFFSIARSQQTTILTNGHQIINDFNHMGKNSKRTEFGSNGKPIWSIEFLDDNTQSKTVFHNQSQMIYHYDHQDQMISTTHIFNHNQKRTASAQLLTAWHEAGHAVAYIYNNHHNTAVTSMSIHPDQTTQSQGRVHIKQIHQEAESIEFLEKNSLAALCGGIAEQILLSQHMLENQHEILDYFSHQRFRQDIHQVRSYVRKIINLQYGYPLISHQQIEKENALIARLYKQGYYFISQHVYDVKIIAEQLLSKKILTDEETYRLLRTEKPDWIYNF